MDIQAVILAAGKGSRMTDMTSKCPKALLPIGCRPMVWYAINTLQTNGFKEAIIVLPASNRMEFSQQLQSLPDIRLKLTEETIHSEEMGTADVLKNLIKNRNIKKDLLVVSGDLVTETSLDPLLALHYVNNSSLTVLYTSMTENVPNSQVLGPKTKRGVEKDLVGIECDTQRLMFMASEADFEEEMTINRRVLICCPRFQVHNNLQDSHIYLINKSTFSKWIADDDINSIKGDLIPYLCRHQFNTSIEEKNPILEMSSYNGRLNNNNTAFSCFAVVDRSSFSIRANNLTSYLHSNKRILRLWSNFFPDQNATYAGEKSYQGNGTCVGLSSTIRGSVVGNHCKIGANVKLSNCVIMDRTTIGDGCVLQWTVVCRDTVLQEKCILNNCVVAAEGVVAETKANNEIITNEDRFIEI